MRKEGFSILELLIVLFIFSLSLAFVAPSLSKFYKSAELKTTTQRVSALLRHSRSEAVHRGEVYQILFDPNLKEIKIRSLSPYEEESDKGDKQRSSVQNFFLPKWIGLRDIKVPPSLFPSEYPTIEFYPNGGSNGGSFVLEGLDRQGYLIQVHFLTGMVEIQKV